MTLQLNELSDEIDMSSAPVGLVTVPFRSGLYRSLRTSRLALRALDNARQTS
mgnify:CR=1 FL=1